jgi:1-acyl-sn-glycerol-3-phosphate acyltransferase
MIAIDRSQGIQSLRYVNEKTAEYINNRPVIIFPEGTRTTYKESPELKPGIYSMYKSLNKPVIPIALNSGNSVGLKIIKSIREQLLLNFVILYNRA